MTKKRVSLSSGQLILCVLAVLLLLCAGFAYFFDTLENTDVSFYVQQHRTGVGQLTQEPVTQSFTASAPNLSGVEVMFSNYNKKPKTGSLLLTLTDEDGKELARQEYLVNELKNSSFISLPLPASLSGSAGKTYTLHATSDCTEGKGVTLRMGPRDETTAAGTLTLADGVVDEENGLYLRTLYRNITYGWQGAYTLAALALCALACLPLAGKEKHHEK